MIDTVARCRRVCVPVVVVYVCVSVSMIYQSVGTSNSNLLPFYCNCWKRICCFLFLPFSSSLASFIMLMYTTMKMTTTTFSCMWIYKRTLESNQIHLSALYAVLQTHWTTNNSTVVSDSNCRTVRLYVPPNKLYNMHTNGGDDDDDYHDDLTTASTFLICSRSCISLPSPPSALCRLAVELTRLVDLTRAMRARTLSLSMLWEHDRHPPPRVSELMDSWIFV